MKVTLRDERARQLSERLRTSDHSHMRQRRGAVAALLVAAGAMGVLAAYQVGLLGEVPEPPLEHLDADEVDASAEAYKWLATPDGVLGLGNYAATMALVSMGGVRRASTHPWIPIVTAAKAALDSIQAVRLTLTQWRDHRAFCSWCLLAAGATFVTLGAVVPEARAAVRTARS